MHVCERNVTAIGDPQAPDAAVLAPSSGGRTVVSVDAHVEGAHFTRALAERLDAICALSVREAEAGDRPRPGVVLVAPGDRHLEFDASGAVQLGDGPLVHGCRPAADVAMLSAARVYRQRTIGVVMTGMGKDGAAGALAIRRAEGRTFAQDEASSAIFGMPKAAIDAGAIEEVLPLDAIASRLRYV